MLEWYFILAIALGGIVFLVVMGIIIRHCMKLNHSYTPVSDVEPGYEEKEAVPAPTLVEKITEDEENIPLASSDSPRQSSKRVRIASETNAANRVIVIDDVNESTAEVCLSDRSDQEDSSDTRSVGSIGSAGSIGSIGSAGSFNSRRSLSAYGDSGTTMSGSMISLASNASWTSLKTVSNLNLNVQCSLIYSRDMRHIAGKVCQCQGLIFHGMKKPTHVRVHVVVLPVKKYALKTSWYEIPTDGEGRVKIGEYFKFVFKLPPSELKTMLRVRLYGRKAKVGSLGRPACLGECYVTLLEVINSKGGLTLWRTLSRGIPEAIVESQTD